MQIRPLEDRVLIERIIERDRVSPGGLHLPDSVEERGAKRGRVVAVGPGRLRDDGIRTRMSVKTGDVVLFREYAGTELRHHELDASHIMMRQDDIEAVEE